MQFSVDYESKKEITKLVIKNTGYLSKLQLSAKLMKLLMIIGAASYVGINFALPDMNLINIRGVPTKDYFNIIKNTCLIIFIGLLLFMVLKLLLTQLSSKDINERVQEALFIEDEVLHYAFRTRFQSDVDTRIIIQIPLKGITSLFYEKRIKKYVLKGNILCYYVENFDEKQFKNTKPSKLDDFVIYDYFDPTLSSCFQEHGLNIQRRNQNEF